MFIFFSRLAISENGCNAILEHENSQHILSKLVHSLGVDEAGTVFLPMLYMILLADTTTS